MLRSHPERRPAGFANLFNVPKARSYGAEAELSWRVTDALSTRLAVGLLGTKMVRTEGESAVFAETSSTARPISRSLRPSIGEPLERLRLSGQVRHHSPYFSDPKNSPHLRIGSATNVDARVAYDIGRVSLFGQVRNLFDALNMLSLGTAMSGEAEDPRTFAVGIESRF